MKYLLTATISVGLLAGCDQGGGLTPFATFNQTAGSEVDQGNFGNATMNNTLVQTGAQEYTVNLANRFAAETNDTINFAFNSSTLDEGAKAVLRQQATWIKQFPEIRFKVFGHTDLVGSSAYNRRLGLRRAQTAVNYLIGQGIDRSRLEAVASFGETRPVVATQGRELRNRRTVTEVSGFVENHPTVLNGKYAEVIFREYQASAVPLSGLTPLATNGAGGG